MSILESASKTLASQILIQLGWDTEREEVLAYGALSLLHTLWSVTCIIATGILLGTLFHIMLIALPSAFLRKYSGGAHATSGNRCAVISAILFGILSYAAKYFSLFIHAGDILLFQIAATPFTILVLSQYCPNDNPNKPIDNMQKRQRLLKASYRLVLIMGGLTVLLWLIFIKFQTEEIIIGILCIHIGLAWQAYTITPWGRVCIHVMDTFLQRLRV